MLSHQRLPYQWLTSQNLGPKIKHTILKALAADEETSFLRSNAEFQKLIKDIDK